MDNDKKENVVVIEEPIESGVESNVEQKEGLSKPELELAKKHNVDIGEEKNDEENKIVNDKSKSEKVKNDIPVEELDSFEKLHDIYQSKPELFYKLPKNIKQLYHSQKGLYKRMKDEEEKRKRIEDEAGLGKIQNSVAKIKLDKIKQRLSNPEGISIEELQELIDEKKEVEDNKDRPLTAKDLERIKEKEKEEAETRESELKERQQIVAGRIEKAESIAKENIYDITGGKYDNFDDVVRLAQELAVSKPRYKAQIVSVINGEDDPQEIIDVIVDIAKLNPKWGSSASTEKKTDKETIDKLVKNASKQATSASLTGGRGTREIHISEDMDPEDAARVWDKIPREIRHKILRKLPA